MGIKETCVLLIKINLKMIELTLISICKIINQAESMNSFGWGKRYEKTVDYGIGKLSIT
jgi:hypothetical protein